MEIKSKQKRQRLSLSSPLKKLQSALWEQKRQNNIIEKENIILNTKINAIQNNPSHKNPHHESTGPRQRLQQLYEQIKQQQQWIKQTTALIGQKRYETEVIRKCMIQKKLARTSRRCVSINKKLKQLKKRVQKEQQSFKESPFFLANKAVNSKQPKQIRPDDVLAELQKQHQQLSQILQYKQGQLGEENSKVKSLNGQLIELLELKSYLKKYINRSRGNLLPTPTPAEKKLSQQTQSLVTESKFSTFTPVKGIKKDSSQIRQEPKLKITTY